jgi:hypothetical protein
MNWRDLLSPDESARLDELYAARRANQDEINRIAKRCRKRMERLRASLPSRGIA